MSMIFIPKTSSLVSTSKPQTFSPSAQEQGRENLGINASGGLVLDVIGEIPSGLLNGSNTVFTTAFDFAPESVEVFINGIRQRVTDDYTTSGLTTITLLTSLISTESITVNYRKS